MNTDRLSRVSHACVYRKCILDFAEDQEFNLTPFLPPNENQMFFKTAGCLFLVSVYVCIQLGGVREVKLIFIEYLPWVRHFARCYTQTIAFFKQTYEDKKLHLGKAQTIFQDYRAFQTQI